jgi:hypothetical protein
MIFQIRSKAHLIRQWTDWLEDLTITLEDNGDTLLTDRVVDQAAWHGLKKIGEMGMPLLSVICLEPGQADAPDFQRQIEAS